jgi:putative transposase
MRLIRQLSKRSKHIYNSGLYCWRQWYALHKVQIEYFVQNFEQNLTSFSPNDRLILAKHFKATKQLDKLKLLIEHSHKSEVKLLEFSDENTTQNLTNKEKSINISFIDTKNIIDSLNIEIDFFKKIKDVDEKNSALDRLTDFQENIIKALEKKVTSNDKTKKRKKSEEEATSNDGTKKKKVKKKKFRWGPVNKVNLIIRSTPEATTIENYCAMISYSYTKMPSQVAQQTLRKLAKSFSSFFELRKKGMKANIPKYLTKKDFYPVIFQNKSFLVQKKHIRLSLGTENKKDLGKKKKKPFIYVKSHHKKSQKIVQIEINPKHNGRWFTINYIIDKVEIISPSDPIHISEHASIDLGEINLATMFVPNKHVRPLIISGKELRDINNKTKYSIKTLSKKHSKYTDKHYNVWKKRELKIVNYLHVASALVIKHCENNGIKKLIIGYNKNWKNKVNMGKRNNGKFYQIPYRRFVNMIFYKAAIKSIRVIETNESYTSKCDSLNMEKVGYHDKYSGKRTNRGLFKSAVGFSVNADVNAAINIMRKYLEFYDKTFVESLAQIVSDMYQMIKSPLKTGIVKKTVSKNGENYLSASRVFKGRDSPSFQYDQIVNRLESEVIMGSQTERSPRF